MKIYELADDLSMIDVEPPIPGWDEFIGIYVLKAEQVALIDVGPQSSAGNLINGLQELAVNLGDVSHILLTHIHLDHAGALSELLEFLPKAIAVVHPKGLPHLVDTKKLWEGTRKALGNLAEQYGQPHNIAPERILAAEDGMRIKLGEELQLEVIHTPGHAAHHMSFLELRSRILFAGEAAGVYTNKLDLLRPATPPPLILEYMLASIERLLEHDPSTIYNGHFGFGGDAQHQILKEKAQLELWQEVIGRALENGMDPESIFSELMEKDAGLGRLKELSQDQYKRECYFMKNSIKGFMGYFDNR